MNKPTYEELQEQLKVLEATLAKKSKPKQKEIKPITFNITLEGNIAIFNLTRKTIILSSEALDGILNNAQELVSFRSKHKSLLSLSTDTEVDETNKELAREKDMDSDNPVVVSPRKRRTKHEIEMEEDFIGGV